MNDGQGKGLQMVRDEPDDAEAGYRALEVDVIYVLFHLLVFGLIKEVLD